MNFSSRRDQFALSNQKLLGWTPAESPFFLGFEFEKLNLDYWSEYALQRRNYAFYAGAVYILTIFGIQSFMRDRKPLNLKLPLFIWNACLGIGSIFGFIRMFPGLVTVISQPDGFYKSICSKEGLDIPTVFWGFMFVLSKYVELGDTVLIVLRKRPLIFLQLYHHLITLCAAWIIAPFGEPIMRWYAILNLLVHSLMYPYFALRAIGVKVPSLFANLITTLQLAQMVCGFLINVSTWYFYSNGYGCIRYPVSINTFIVVYGSFILLFGQLFYDYVIKGRSTRSEKKE